MKRLTSYESISVILQGALSGKTQEIIEKWRRSAPGCEIILSTWSDDQELTGRVDKYLISPDPGVFPVVCNGKVIRTENTNRQIVSTRAGLEQATRRFALKWRTDFDFDSVLMARFLSEYLPLIEGGRGNRFVVFSINSTNPFAGVRLVAQLSDWMYFGKTDLLLDLVPSMPITLDRENIEIPFGLQGKAVFPIARFSAEQWMLREGLARVYGVELSRFDDADSIRPYLKLIGSSVLIINPRRVGLVTGKYDYIFDLEKKAFRAFFGFRMSTISEVESKFLGIKFLRKFAVGALRCKALIFDIYKFFAREFRS